MTIFFMIFVALLLVLLNGFFVAAEFSLVKLRQTRVSTIAKKSGLRGRLLLTVHHNLDAYLSACQLGITLASLGLGWIGEPAFAGLLHPFFDLFGITSVEIIHGVSFFAAFFLISYLHIVVGELAPKSMAIRMPETVSLWSAPFLYAFYWLMYPVIWVLNTSSDKVLKWVGLNLVHASDGNYSKEELRLILRASHGGVKNAPEEWHTMMRVLDFSNLVVSDLMRPINEVVGIYKGASCEEMRAVMAQNRLSRYPYFAEDKKTVLGIVHLKDIFFAEHEGKIADLSAYVRQVDYVRPTMSAQELFYRFKTGAPHFALVGYKGHNPVGFLTLDNLLSAFVGQIRDEFSDEDNDWVVLEDGSLVGKGSLPLYTLGTVLGIELDSDEVESIGGLVMQKLGEVPVSGQRIEFSQFDVVVKQMNGPRIALVNIYPK